MSAGEISLWIIFPYVALATFVVGTFILQPDVAAVQGANTVYQAHAILAWACWALVPFSRAVSGSQRAEPGRPAVASSR